MDARYYNGGPDDDPGFALNGRREPGDDGRDYYGRPCGTCGRPCHRIYTLADVGIFCSPGCRQRATEPQQKQGAA